MTLSNRNVHQKLVAGFLLAAASHTAVAASCPDSLSWQDATEISTQAQGATVSMTRYQDGLYAKLDTGKERKEMYQFNAGNRVYLTHGVTATPEGAYVRDFLGLEKFVWLPVVLLSQKYPRPCALNGSQNAEFDLAEKNEFGMPPAHIRASVEHKDGNTITYKLAVLAPGSASGGAPLQEYQGVWYGGEPQNKIPDGLDVMGWNVSIQGQGVKELSPFPNPNKTYKTLDALKKALAEWKPQQ